MRTIRRSFSSILNLLFLFSVISFTSCESEKENITYRIDVISGEGGTATSSHKEIMEGWEVKLTAIAEDNYRFVNWTVNGKEVSTSNPYTATITAHTQFRANFEKDNYKVTIKAGEGGSAKATPEGEVLKGTKVTFTAIPQDGYGFANWTVNGKVVSTSNPYIATITKDIEIHANFITHKVVVIAGEGGTAKTSNTTVGHKEETTLTAIPYEGYQFLSWTVNGKVVSKNRTFTTSITADTEFVANFIKIITKINGGGLVKTTSNTNGTITLSAIPDESYQFLNWTINGKEVSNSNPYTTIIAKDINVIANFTKRTYNNGHEYIDLGLSVKWATCNIGATSPEGYGDYYAWGETYLKENFYWDTYSYCNGSENSQIKYCTDTKYGKVDNKKILELSDDAAYVNWGENWRIPTSVEMLELIDNCNYEWTIQNGINGLKMTSKKNGNFIFLPAAGCSFASLHFGEVCYVNHHKEGIQGYYWTSSLKAGQCYEALSLSIDKNMGWLWGAQERFEGQTIRAVCP